MKNLVKNVGILTCLALLFLFVSQVLAPWKYNPFTRKLDYYSVAPGGDFQFADIYHTDFIGTDYYDCGNSGASITIDWNNGNIQHVTLTAIGVDLTFTEPPHPGHCELWIIQDGTGNRTIDWAHEINPEWPGGVAPTLSTGGADVDVAKFTFIGGTTYRGLFNGNFTT